MKAVLCETLGEKPVVREVDPPGPPGPGQVNVRLVARGISYTDLLMARGEYQVKPELPFPFGGEGAGHVSAVGKGVTSLTVGDPVLAPGGCVEEVQVSAERVTKLPPGVDLEVAASFRGNYQTALLGMQRARLEAGEVLLVHGAAGGVGLAAVDLGKLMGATVIATASSEAKLEVVGQMGADHLINYSTGFRDQVKALTSGRGADVIYDPVGGDVFDESMRCIAPMGRILIVGFTGGRPALAKTNHLLIKDASVIGFTVGGFNRHSPDLMARNARTLMNWLASGRIRPYISHRLPLERAAEALDIIERREVIGKVIVT